VAEFSRLLLTLEGASALLSGSYELANERLDFHGPMVMAAKLSQTASGPKALILKAADPFYRGKGNFRGKRAGSQVPIKIGGTRSNPTFGLELGDKTQHNKTAPNKTVNAGLHSHGVLSSH
jgi:hypothetical protein